MNNSTNNQIHSLEYLLKTLKDQDIARPSPTFRQNARIRLLNVARVSTCPPSTIFSRPQFFTISSRFALAVIFLLAGIIYSAQSSFPGNPLFPVKVLSERVALTLAPTNTTKTTVANTIITRRFEEIEQVQKKGNDQEVTQSITNLTNDVEEIKHIKNVSHDIIDKTIERHKDVIEEIHSKEEKRHTNKHEDKFDNEKKSSRDSQNNDN